MFASRPLDVPGVELEKPAARMLIDPDRKNPREKSLLSTERTEKQPPRRRQKPPGSNTLLLSLCSNRVCPTKVTLRLDPRVTVSGVERLWSL